MAKKKQQQIKPAIDTDVYDDEPLGKDNFGSLIVLRSALLCAAVVVILAGIKAASAILTPVLLALFITIILLVPLRWLHTKGCPSLLAFFIVGGTICALVIGLGWVLTNSLNDFIKRGPLYVERITDQADEIERRLHKYGYTLSIFADKNEEANDQPNKPNGEQADSEQPEQQNTTIQNVPNALIASTTETPITSETESAVVDTSTTEEVSNYLANDETPPSLSYEQLNTKTLVDWIIWGANQLRHVAESVFLILVILMFMIFEAARFPAKLDVAFGKGPVTNEHFQKIIDDVRRYVLFKGGINLLSCGLVTIFYFCIGVQYALLWGLIAFFLYFIPNIGSIIASIPPLLLMFVDHGLGGAATLVVGLLIIEMAIGYGLEPRLLGHGLGISTVVVFLSLIFWGWLLGPVGMFLAAPLTIVTKIILQAFEETRWIAILLDEKVPVMKNRKL